jgi:hypothetical protein
MALEVLIGAETYRVADTYSIKQQGGAVSTSDIDVLVESDQEVPLSLSPCTISSDSVPFFWGIVRSVQSPQFEGGLEVQRYRLTVQSGEVVFNNRLVSEAFVNKYTHEIVAELFTNYIEAEGITLGEISTTTQLYENYNCQFAKLYDVLTELASDIGATFEVTPGKVFNFITRGSFDLIDAPERITQLRIEEDAGSLRTVQIVTGASEETSDQTENNIWLADQTAMVLGYQVSNITGFTINGSPATFGYKGVDEGVASITFLYEVGSNIIAVNSAATVKPTTGQNVICVYSGYYDIIVTNKNDQLAESIMTLNGTSGLIEVVHTDETIDTFVDADAKATALLEQNNERAMTVSCSIQGLDDTDMFLIWDIKRPDINIVGQYVIVERLISSFGADMWVKLKLRNKGFLSQYGTVLTNKIKRKNETTKVYKQSAIGDTVHVTDALQIVQAGMTYYPTASDFTDPVLDGFYPMGA